MTVAAVVLAAGRSSRMGFDKLTAVLWGVPVVGHAVDAALASRAAPVVVVVGARDEPVRAALAGRRVCFVHNSDAAAGLATSLRAGIGALSENTRAAIVCLGDMPCIRSDHIDALIDAHGRSPSSICVPVHGGTRGNPVLWPACYFAELARLEGDVGGRHVLERHAQDVCAVPTADDAILIDVDTPETLDALERQSPRAGNIRNVTSDP